MEDFLWLDERLTAEERMVRDGVRRFVDEAVLPCISEAYEKGAFPQHLIPQIAELGLLGMTLPEAYGGSAASDVAYGLVCQELERGDSGLRSFVSVQSSLCMYPIFAFGSETQKTKFLPAMARGDVIGCFGLTEPDSGSDPSAMQTRATPVSGGWQLNGSKMWITNGHVSDIAIVWAKTDNGIRGFLVEKGTPGFTRNPIAHKMSLRASDTSELVFDNCVLPNEALLPGSECGIRAPLSCLTQARFGIAWGAMGAAMACYEAALDYAKHRRQFDKPIAANQMVQADLVNMFSEILKGQCLNFALAQAKADHKITPAMVSLGKRNACFEALKIARMARDILGANGISLEYPVIRHLMNLETVKTYEGTHNIHTLVLGKHITGINAF